jgi:hypothetical protein
MKTPLVPVQILSVYTTQSGQRVFLPQRMAQCTPDTHNALISIKNDVEKAGGQLYLSDLFRSYDMQLQAHLDYTSGKKKAFSPAPGGSMHEAGRAFDLDLAELKMPLAKFWKIAGTYGVFPIIKKPDSALKEAWHFDCRGSHGKVYDYYTAGKGTNIAPYQAMAASAILSIGVSHDLFKGREREAAIQSLLIRLGYEIGNIDGQVGMKTNKALSQAGIISKNLDDVLTALENMAQKKFSIEYHVDQQSSETSTVPAHVIQ